MKVRILFLLMVLLISIVAMSQILTLTLWTAPNPYQDMFWRQIVSEWNKTHPDIQIKWSEIPAAGSSEESILTAIASGRQPDICDNIFTGFGEELVDSNVLVPLDSFPGFQSLISLRHMKTIIKHWDFDGHYYVFPEYVNPMLIWWRKSILQKYGFDQPPRTYTDLYELAQKVDIPHRRYALLFYTGPVWSDRWFDFIMYYYAASGGQPYVNTQAQVALFDNEYGKEVANFIYTLFKNGYSSVDLASPPFESGAVVGCTEGPWNIPYEQTQFPDIYKDVVVSPPLVPDNYPKDKPIYTFADSKGMVIFKSTKAKEDAAWEFMKWVYSNPNNDVLWIKLTGMPPARSDLLTNPIFAPYMKDNPIFAAYAKYVPYAVPPSLSSKTVDIQQAMTTYLVEPLIYLKSTPDQALQQCVSQIDNILFQ